MKREGEKKDETIKNRERSNEEKPKSSENKIIKGRKMNKRQTIGMEGELWEEKQKSRERERERRMYNVWRLK